VRGRGRVQNSPAGDPRAPKYTFQSKNGVQPNSQLETLGQLDAAQTLKAHTLLPLAPSALTVSHSLPFSPIPDSQWRRRQQPDRRPSPIPGDGGDSSQAGVLPRGLDLPAASATPRGRPSPAAMASRPGQPPLGRTSPTARPERPRTVGPPQRWRRRWQPGPCTPARPAFPGGQACCSIGGLGGGRSGCGSPVARLWGSQHLGLGRREVGDSRCGRRSGGGCAGVGALADRAAEVREPGFRGPVGFRAPAGFGVGAEFPPEWDFGFGAGLLFGFRGRVRERSTRTRPAPLPSICGSFKKIHEKACNVVKRRRQ
jgi:hypothetical protein